MVGGNDAGTTRSFPPNFEGCTDAQTEESQVNHDYKGKLALENGMVNLPDNTVPNVSVKIGERRGGRGGYKIKATKIFLETKSQISRQGCRRGGRY